LCICFLATMRRVLCCVALTVPNGQFSNCNMDYADANTEQFTVRGECDGEMSCHFMDLTAVHSRQFVMDVNICGAKACG
jgi:hypothetical protein